MYPSVAVEIGLLGEAFIAVRALEGFVGGAGLNVQDGALDLQRMPSRLGINVQRTPATAHLG